MAERRKVSSGPLTRSAKARSTASPRRSTSSMVTRTVQARPKKASTASKGARPPDPDEDHAGKAGVGHAEECGIFSNNTTLNNHLCVLEASADVNGTLSVAGDAQTATDPPPASVQHAPPQISNNTPNVEIGPTISMTSGLRSIIASEAAAVARNRFSSQMVDTDTNTDAKMQVLDNDIYEYTPNVEIEEMELVSAPSQLDLSSNAANETTGWKTISKRPTGARVDKILILKPTMPMGLKEFVTQLKQFLSTHTHIANFNISQLERGDFCVVFKNNTAKTIASKAIESEDSIFRIIPRGSGSPKAKWLDSKQKFEVLVHNVPKHLESKIREVHPWTFRKGRNLIITFDSRDKASSVCQEGLFIESSYFRVSPFTFPPKEFRISKDLCKSCLNSHEGECSNEPRCNACNEKHKTADCPSKIEATRRKFHSYRDALISHSTNTSSATRPPIDLDRVSVRPQSGKKIQDPQVEPNIDQNSIMDLVNQAVESSLKAIIPVIIREVLSAIGMLKVDSNDFISPIDQSRTQSQSFSAKENTSVTRSQRHMDLVSNPELEDPETDEDPNWPYNDPDYPFDMDVNDDDKHSIDSVDTSSVRITLSPPKRQAKKHEKSKPTSQRNNRSYKDAIQKLSQKPRRSNSPIIAYSKSPVPSRVQSDHETFSKSDLGPQDFEESLKTQSTRAEKRKLRKTDIRSPILRKNSQRRKLIKLIELMGSNDEEDDDSDPSDEDLHVYDNDSAEKKTARKKLVKLADLRRGSDLRTRNSNRHNSTEANL